MTKTIILILSIFILSGNKIYSCSCEKSSIKYGFAHSDLIFTGTVVEINKKKFMTLFLALVTKGNIMFEK